MTRRGALAEAAIWYGSTVWIPVLSVIFGSGWVRWTGAIWLLIATFYFAAIGVVHARFRWLDDRAGTEAAAAVDASESAASGTSLPVPDARKLHPSSGIASKDLHLGLSDAECLRLLDLLRGPEGGVE